MRQHFGFLSEYTVYCYSLILQFINCNVINLHNTVNSRRCADQLSPAASTFRRCGSLVWGHSPWPRYSEDISACQNEVSGSMFSNTRAQTGQTDRQTQD